MNIRDFMQQEGEMPLDRMVANGGFCGIFRRIACIGDSLSSGEFESFENDKKGFHDYYDYSWGQYIARDAGCTVLNFSKGGMSVKRYADFAREKGYYDPALACQAYIIALGVNDVSQILAGEIELGDTGDVDLKDEARNKPTFVGLYAKIIAKYQSIQPKAKFFLMTPPRGTEKDEKRTLYDRQAELIRTLSTMFENCYVLDFRKYAPIYDDEFRRNFFLGGHLNAAGYRLTALMVESYIDYLVRNNPEDFAQIGFVGTPYHNATAKW